MEENQLLETNLQDVTSLATHSAAMATWTDDKKGEFVGTFKKRSCAARFILHRTGVNILEIALNRKFISERHRNKVKRARTSELLATVADQAEQIGSQIWSEGQPLVFKARAYGAVSGTVALTVGGRSTADLNEIAVARAKEVLSNLPPLQDAVRVIDPETAKMLDRIEKVKAAGQKLTDTLDDVCEPIIASELDQTMTLGAFLKLVKDRDKRRRDHVRSLRKLGEEGRRLEAAVAKKLYKGLPGLSDAVLDVAKTHFERATALDELSRRVEEQVKFGDSDEALQMLQYFEKDEVEISSSVGDQFREALAKLKLTVKRGRRAPAKELAK